MQLRAQPNQSHLKDQPISKFDLCPPNPTPPQMTESCRTQSLLNLLSRISQHQCSTNVFSILSLENVDQKWCNYGEEGVDWRSPWEVGDDLLGKEWYWVKVGLCWIKHWLNLGRKLMLPNIWPITPQVKEHQNIYRVTLEVSDLGWVDLDLGCSTLLLGQ